jgi:hypothetical protein
VFPFLSNSFQQLQATIQTPASQEKMGPDGSGFPWRKPYYSKMTLILHRFPGLHWLTCAKHIFIISLQL